MKAWWSNRSGRQQWGVAVVAALVLIAFGAAVNTNTRVETRTIVAAAKPAKTIVRNHTVTKIVNSPACERAIQVAGRAFAVVAGAIQDSGGYIPLIEAAAKAGYNQDAGQINAVSSREQAVTAKVSAAGRQLQQIVSSYSPGSCA